MDNASVHKYFSQIGIIMLIGLITKMEYLSLNLQTSEKKEGLEV